MKTINKNTTFRSKVFKYAWQIVKATKKTFSVALAKAWQVYKLKKRMMTDIVKFSFEKSDGSLRVAHGTLQNLSDKIKGTGKANYKTLAYLDTEKQAFRCFKIENLINIY